MPENILGALFHLTKPYHAAALAQRERRWTRRVGVPLAGQTLGILGLGAIGQEVARKAAVLECGVIGTRRHDGPLPGVDRSSRRSGRRRCWRNRISCCAAAGHAGDHGDHGRAPHCHDEAQRLPAEFRPRPAHRRCRPGRRSAGTTHRRRGPGRVPPGAAAAGTPFWGTEGITVLPHIGGMHPTARRAGGGASAWRISAASWTMRHSPPWWIAPPVTELRVRQPACGTPAYSGSSATPVPARPACRDA